MQEAEDTCAAVTLAQSRACCPVAGEYVWEPGRLPEAWGGGGVSQETLKPAGVKVFRAPFRQLLRSDHPWFPDPDCSPQPGFLRPVSGQAVCGCPAFSTTGGASPCALQVSQGGGPAQNHIPLGPKPTHPACSNGSRPPPPPRGRAG